MGAQSTKRGSLKWVVNSPIPTKMGISSGFDHHSHGRTSYQLPSFGGLELGGLVGKLVSRLPAARTRGPIQTTNSGAADVKSGNKIILVFFGQSTRKRSLNSVCRHFLFESSYQGGSLG